MLYWYNIARSTNVTHTRTSRPAALRNAVLLSDMVVFILPFPEVAGGGCPAGVRVAARHSNAHPQWLVTGVQANAHIRTRTQSG